MESKGQELYPSLPAKRNQENHQQSRVLTSPCPQPPPQNSFVSLAQGSTTLLSNGIFSPRGYKIVLGFLVFLCHNYSPSRGSSCFSEKVFITSPFSNLYIPKNKDGGKSNTTSPLAVGMTCLDEGWNPS